MGRDSRYHMRIVQDRKEVTRLHLLGYTQQAIGEKLGKDQGNISRMLKRIRNELDKDAVNNMGEVRAVQNARLEGILKEYWEMYSSGVMDKPEAAVAGALKTVSEISKLLGVNINPAQIIDQKITTETVDPATLASKLASVFGDADVVDGEVIEAAQLEHDTGDADVEQEEETIADDHIADDDIPDDHITVAAEAVTELPAQHDTGIAPHEASPPPNAGVVIGRKRPTPQQPGNDSVAAAALAEQLAARFSS